MEVIKGNFGEGQETDEPLTMKEALIEGLEKSEWADVTGGKFFLVMDTEDSMSFVTNETHPAEVILMMEIVKQAIVSTQ